VSHYTQCTLSRKRVYEADYRTKAFPSQTIELSNIPLISISDGTGKRDKDLEGKTEHCVMG